MPGASFELTMKLRYFSTSPVGTFGTLLLSLFASVGILKGCGTDEPAGSECGNGRAESAEVCDDGNTQSGDGCDVSCVIEPGWSCVAEGLPCFTTCGDGVRSGLEACDDSNREDGDGCSATCELEASAEVCTDAVDNDGDGLADCEDTDCLAACAVEVCVGGIDEDNDEAVDCADTDCSTVAPCGAENTEAACADRVDNDGDNALDCLDPDCAGVCSAGVCGDGDVNVGEECDDGEENSSTTPDACRPDCSLPGCGDGVVDEGESCDSARDATCSVACGRNALASCPDGESNLFRFDFADGATESAVALTLSRAEINRDDVEFPQECAALNGGEWMGVLSVPQPGLWYITSANEGTNVEVALAVLDACSSTALVSACDVGVGRLGRGEVLVEVAAGAELVIMAEVYGVTVPAVVNLRAQLVLSSASEGQTCVGLPDGPVCNTGLVCMDGRCEAPTLPVLGEGDACDADERLNVCGPGLACSEAGRCQFEPGADCGTPQVVDLSSLDDGDTLFVETDQGPLRSNYELGCGSVGSGRVIELSGAAEGVVRVTVSSARASTTLLALASRSLCTVAASEAFCLRSPVTASLAGLTEWVELDGDTPAYVFVSGAGLAELEIEFFEAVADGRPCTAESARACLNGSACTAGACLPTDGGSCDAPLNGIDLAGGPLGLTPLVLELPTEGLTDTGSVPGCTGGTGRDVTLEFVAPSTGLVSASFLSGYPGLAIGMDVACPGVLETPLCSGPGGGVVGDISLEVFTGQRVFITVDGIQPSDPPLLLLVFENRREFGEACSASDRCVSNLVCDDVLDTCQFERSALGGECGRGVICEPDLFCSPISNRCDLPLGPGSLCDVAADLVECPEGTTCLGTISGANCRTGTALVGQPCGGVVTCTEGTVCVGGLPGVWAGVCAPSVSEEGTPCDYQNVTCGGTLECAWYADQPTGFCLNDPGEGIGRICDSAVAAGGCAAGERCQPFDSVSTVGLCVGVEGRDGEVCLSSNPACAADFECIGLAGSEAGLCTRRPFGGGQACTFSDPEVCVFPLVCRLTDESDRVPTCEVALRPGDGCVAETPVDPCISASSCVASPSGSTCDVPTETVGLGESCLLNLFCDSGLGCYPLDPITFVPSTESRCLPILLEGATCTDDELAGVCDFGLECRGTPGATTCQPAG